MDFEAWTVDLTTLSATHESGFSLSIEGHPKDPSNVNPGRFPAGLSGVEQARLLRHGIEALAKAAPARGAANKTVPYKNTKPKKPVYNRPANKPKRPVLSLKKREEA